jgi:hypothetical protein
MDLAMEPSFKALVVAAVPQPRQIPPPPFAQEDLQKLFVEITRDYAYQQFSFTPGGAQLVNAPDDLVAIQPGIVQTQVRIDPAFTTNSAAATDKAVTILKRCSARLKIEGFLQCGIKVVAHVPLPGDQSDAKDFVAQRLMPAIDPDDLAPGFFAGGVKYRRVSENEGEEANLLIEPFLHDNHFLYIDYDVARMATTGPIQDFDQLASWIGESFSFVAGPTMNILSS